MTRFRPRLAPTLFTIPMLLICVGLGIWQLQRLEWKSGLIAQRQAAVADPRRSARDGIPSRRR
jgi:surfeit locus 1 family protein